MSVLTPSGTCKPKDMVGMPWRVAFALQADGWYLRSDIIWHKPNPMPESVTDRPTKAHEYLFLLTKSERYYYDAEAIAERNQAIARPNFDGTSGKLPKGSYQGIDRCGNARKPRTAGNKNHKYVTEYETSETEEHRTKAGLMKVADVRWEKRNKRSVWAVPTEPYPEAHFATFPTALIEPCIKAGCPAGGTVLDPFGGSGTTMQVARALGCRGLMIELNRDYCRLAAKRLRQAVLSLAETPDNISQESRQETKDLFEENSVA